MLVLPVDVKYLWIRIKMWVNLGRGIGAFKMTSLSLMMECLGGFLAINFASAVYFLPSSTNLSISWNAGLSDARERSITDLFPRRIPTRFCAFFTQLKVTRRSFGNISKLWLNKPKAIVSGGYCSETWLRGWKVDFSVLRWLQVMDFLSTCQTCADIQV